LRLARALETAAARIETGGPDFTTHDRATEAARDRRGAAADRYVGPAGRCVDGAARASSTTSASTRALSSRPRDCRRAERRSSAFSAAIARELLDHSALALDDIAASLGYAGVSAFMRSFRRWTGAAPGQLRKRGRDPALET